MASQMVDLRVESMVDLWVSLMVGMKAVSLAVWKVE